MIFSWWSLCDARTIAACVRHILRPHHAQRDRFADLLGLHRCFFGLLGVAGGLLGFQPIGFHLARVYALVCLRLVGGRLGLCFTN